MPGMIASQSYLLAVVQLLWTAVVQLQVAKRTISLPTHSLLRTAGMLLRVRWLEPLPEAATWVSVRDALGGDDGGVMRVEMNKVCVQARFVCKHLQNMYACMCIIVCLLVI